MTHTVIVRFSTSDEKTLAAEIVTAALKSHPSIEPKSIKSIDVLRVTHMRVNDVAKVMYEGLKP